MHGAWGRARGALAAATIAACGTDAPPDDAAASTVDGWVAVVAGDVVSGWSDGPGLQARFGGATALCAPADGRFLLLADTFNGTIRRVDLPAGVVSTVAGRFGAPGQADGVDARLAEPRGLGCHPDGSVAWFADVGLLRRLDLVSGEVTTVAGQSGQHALIDGSATQARFGYLVHALVSSPDGATLWLSDRSNNAIREVNTDTWSVRTLPVRGLDGPGGLALVGGTLWIADTFGNRLRGFVLATEEVITLPPRVDAPQGVAWDGSRLLAVGFGDVIRAVDPLDPGEQAVQLDAPFVGTFASPVWRDGRLWYPGLGNQDLRSVDPVSGAASVVAGPTDPVGHVDGPLADARFDDLTAVTGDATGRLWVADPYNAAVREVDRGGDQVRTLPIPDLAQPVAVALGPDGDTLAIADGGRVLGWSLTRGQADTLIEGRGEIAAVTWAENGTLYAADGSEAVVVARGADGVVAVVAGDGSRGHRDGSPGRLRDPVGLAVSGSTLWISDGHLVRALEGGVLRTVVGAPGEAGDVAGGGAVARLRDPRGLAVDGAGRLWIADTGNHKLRRYDPIADELLDVGGAEARAGGVPPGPGLALADAGFGWLTAVFVAGDEVLVTAQASLLRVEAPTLTR